MTLLTASGILELAVAASLEATSHWAAPMLEQGPAATGGTRGGNAVRRGQRCSGAGETEAAPDRAMVGTVRRKG